MVKITWNGNDVLIKAHWIVQSVQLHTLLQWKGHDCDQEPRDTVVLYVEATAEQIRALQDEFPGTITTDILGISVLPIIPGRPIWVWTPPKDYKSLPTYSYDSFVITEVPDHV